LTLAWGSNQTAHCTRAVVRFLLIFDFSKKIILKGAGKLKLIQHKNEILIFLFFLSVYIGLERT
jgi:hypothetical protein